MVHSISLVSALSISEIQYNVFQKISIVLLSRRTAALQKARTIVTVYICNEYHKSWFKVHFKGAVASWSHARANRTYWEPGSTKTFHHRCEKHWFVANKRSRCVFLGNNACYSDASRLVLYFMCFFYVGTGSSWAHRRYWLRLSKFEERISSKICLATQLINRMVLQCIKKLSSLRTEFLVS